MKTNSLFKFLTLIAALVSFNGFGQTTDNYNYTGAPVVWVVPPCVTSIDIVMDGAQGGGYGGATGGNGANVTATIPVLPGDIIEIIVGGQGGCPAGGYPGGGDGVNSSDGTAAYGSCGGGGHTQISVNGVLTGVAAAGGGGGGGSDNDNGGGNGGCATGFAGDNTYGDGGGGGTATAGGAGGAPWAGTPPGGFPGGFLFGGDGGPWLTAPGGGGGSGYYGGGGGGNDGCCTGANGGGGGGGGSSLTPGGGACSAGANTGDGFASITYIDAIPPNPGAANVTPDPVCEGDDVTLDLVGWTGVSIQWQSAPAPGGPWTDIAGATSDPYVYTGITANTCFRAEVTGDCPPNVFSASYCVTVDPLPTAANAGPDQSICGTTGTLAGNVPVDGTGTWTIAAGGSTVTTPGNAGSGVTGLTTGLNTYTWTISSGVCPSSSDNVTFTVAYPVNAGADNATSICNTAGSSVDLNPLLGGADPGGTWAETSGSGAFDPTTGILDTDGLAAGAYTFTYTMTGTFPCPDDVADFTVNVEQEVDAGADNATSICNTAGSSVDMNTLLIGADAGGVWAETSGSGAFNAGTGVLNTDGLAAGVYTFTYTMVAVAPCVSDVSNFTVTVEQEVDAGLDNSITSCNLAGSSVDVNTLLFGADPGGVWTETTASGAFNATTGVLTTAGLASGTYTFEYELTAVAPCLNDISSFDVIVSTSMTAGGDDLTITICNAAGSFVDLDDYLTGADIGGTWVETSASGMFTAPTGVLDTDGLAAGVYTFTYSVFPLAPCPVDVADFTVTVEQEADAGDDNSSTICNSAGSNIDLNTLLIGADAGGTWAETTGSGQFTPGTGIFDGSGLVAGVYSFTYTVLGVAPCVTDVSNFDITVSDLPNAGTDNGTSICNLAGTTVDVNTLLTGADPGGVWTETTGSGAFTPSTGILITDGLPAGVYSFNYDIAPIGACPGDQAIHTVTVEQEVLAGADDLTPEICNTAGSLVDLNTSLSGATAGGTWTETTASGAFTGGTGAGTGVLNTDGLAAGVYNFTYEVFGVAPCPNDLSNFTVTVQQEVNAGTNNSTSSCNVGGSFIDLNTLLVGADPTGVWNETTSSGSFTASTGMLDIGGLAGGTYSFNYTMDAIAPCLSDVSTHTVTIEEIPVMDVVTDEEVCDNDILVSQVFTTTPAGAAFTWTNTTGTDVGFGLGGSSNSIGSWLGNSGSTGDVTVTVEVTPTSTGGLGCVGLPVTFDVTVHPLPQVGFLPTETSGCEPFQVSFNSTFPSSPGDVCNWQFGDGSSSSTCDVTTNTYNLSGLYDVSLEVTTAFGCSDQISYTDLIQVYPEAQAEFSYNPGTVDVNDPEVSFTNSSTDASSYTWDFGDHSPSSGEVDPTHIYPNVGNVSYEVSLTAHSLGGCDHTITKLITVDDVILFFIPNVFTPDGDEYNEEFKPIMVSGFDVYDYHMVIYNRWGEVVFESFNAAYGWDGSFGSLGLVEDGTYIWAMEFGETMSDKRHKHKGHVTILK